MAYDRPLVGAAPAIVARPDTVEVETAPSPRRDLVTPAAIALTLVPFVVLAVHMLRTDVFLSAVGTVTTRPTTTASHQAVAVLCSETPSTLRSANAVATV